jgi:thymidylate synthase/dihydrofolate reductase
MRRNNFSLIVACWKNSRIIGTNGQLPWNPLKEDMDFFKRTTTETFATTSHAFSGVNSVIMGKNTWLSIPEKYRPLPGRVNIVVSSSLLKGRQSGSLLHTGKIREQKPMHKNGKIIVGMNPFADYERKAVFCVRNLDEALRIVLPTGRYIDSVPTGMNNSHNVEFKNVEVNYGNTVIQNRFVIGGERLFAESLQHEMCEKIYLTEVDENVIESALVNGEKFNDKVHSSVYFPKIPKYFAKTQSRSCGEREGLEFLTFTNWKDSESQERQYLQLMWDILKLGEFRTDRTKIGTFSLFAKQLTFSMENGEFPLLTTKKVWFKGVVEELLFFLRGDHDNRKLQTKKVHIWDGNTGREYLDDSGRSHIETDDLGLAYGVQWRAAGAKLEGIDANYVGKGIDQIQECIDLINNDPASRRIIINAWNVPQLKDMALVPCHMMYQFYVRKNRNASDSDNENDNNDNNKGYLDCMMTQRSSDSFLGLPFNIASTATLTHILAKTCGYKPGKITVNLGDAHIYRNHIEQVKTQLDRTTLKFPSLLIDKELNNINDIENLTFSDFELKDYHCYPTIKADMAV